MRVTLSSRPAWPRAIAGIVSRDRLQPFQRLLRSIALGRCTYLMHPLAEVLSRDLERTTELRRSEDRYRTLFDRNPFPMWVADPESLRLLDANLSAVEQYGYTREEFLSMTV